jgi:hypothetical protein
VFRSGQNKFSSPEETRMPREKLFRTTTEKPYGIGM